MHVTFAGVGEAFDETLINTTLLAETDTTSILLDCGFSAPMGFWAEAENPLELDALYISHFHGDHYFGIPALITRFHEEGRRKRLTILGQTGVEERVTRLMEMAYSNVLKNAKFEIYYIECSPGQEIPVGDFRLHFAMGDHPMPCLAVRLDAGGKSLFYSGDGKPTDETRNLAAGCDLVAHESFSLAPTAPGHGTVDSSIEFAEKAKAKSLALIHIKRQVRRTMQQAITDKAEAADLHVFLPEPGHNVQL